SRSSPLSFFFSSRRRHTRFSRDWSSDVCSSDLITNASVVAMSGWIIPAPLAMPSTVHSWSAPIGNLIELTFGQRSVVMIARENRSEERRVGKECRRRSWQYAQNGRERGRGRDRQ